jgi:hypothetical protein
VILFSFIIKYLETLSTTSCMPCSFLKKSEFSSFQCWMFIENALNGELCIYVILMDSRKWIIVINVYTREVTVTSNKV